MASEMKDGHNITRGFCADKETIQELDTISRERLWGCNGSYGTDKEILSIERCSVAILKESEGLSRTTKVALVIPDSIGRYI